MPTNVNKTPKAETSGQPLADVSPIAAVSEMETCVLHNVGNVLNSLNVSVTLLRDNLKKSRLSDVGRVAELLRTHQGDLASFLTNDSKGQRVIDFMTQLAEKLTREQLIQAKELESLQGNVAHIKEIVTIKLTNARISGATEIVQIRDLIEDTLRLSAGALSKHDVRVIRDYAEVPEITVDKHKVLQILVNLVSNAKSACSAAGRNDSELTVSVRKVDGHVRISVADNGIGIPSENLTRIFTRGFTTKKDGHGFGLHSGALAAQEVGGTLSAYSDGTGCGAVFILQLPLQPPSRANESGTA
jgi:signal transduction histidine kinase